MKRLLAPCALAAILFAGVGCGGNSVETPTSFAPLPKNFGNAGVGGGKIKADNPGGAASISKD